MPRTIQFDQLDGRWRLDYLEAGVWHKGVGEYEVDQPFYVNPRTYRMVLLTVDPTTGNTVEHKQMQFTITKIRRMTLQQWQEEFQPRGFEL